MEFYDYLKQTQWDKTRFILELKKTLFGVTALIQEDLIGLFIGFYKKFCRNSIRIALG